MTFSRASIGTYFFSSNVLTTASNDVARFNYIAVANLLIEARRTCSLTLPTGDQLVLLRLLRTSLSHQMEPIMAGHYLAVPQVGLFTKEVLHIPIFRTQCRSG
jgi:hypothetical protein